MSRTVAQKLGLKPGMTARVIARPDDLADFDLPASDSAEPDLLIAFAASAADVAPRLAEALPLYRRGKSLWFAYPKKTGRIRTDITRDHGWSAMDEHDLLPVTQVAIDETWSALRFRFRDEIAKLTRKF